MAQGPIQAMATLHYSDVDNPVGSPVYLPNPRGTNRKWNVKILLDGKIKIFQNDPTHRVMLTYRADQIRFISLRAGLTDPKDWNTWRANAAFENKSDEEDMGDLKIATQTAMLEFMITDNKPDYKFMPNQPGNTRGSLNEQFFPLGQLYTRFNRIRLSFADLQKVPNFDNGRVLSFFSGNDSRDPKAKIEDFVKAERAARAAKAKNDALDLLKGIHGQKCRVSTRRWKNESLLVNIWPPNPDRMRNWESILHAGQSISLQNERLFSYAACQSFKSFGFGEREPGA